MGNGDERFSLSIGEVARRFGLRVSALRYYDELGLVRPAGRRGRVRHYDRAGLRRLALVQRLHHRGLVSLADTAALLADAPAAEGPTGREVLAASIGAIEERIEDLRAARALLEHLLTCPTADPVRECRHLRAELERAVDAALEDGPANPRTPTPQNKTE